MADSRYELIKATGGARNTMIDVDCPSDEQLRRLEEDYERISAGGDASDDA